MCRTCETLTAALPNPARTAGYYTGPTGEARAWHIRADGGVECIHAAPACCEACTEADERIAAHFGLEVDVLWLDA